MINNIYLFQSKLKIMNIVVTGGNNGIGLQTIKALHLKGNNIIFGSRNEQKNIQAIKQIKSLSQSKEKTLKAYKLDLSRRQSIEGFAKYVKSEFEKVDVLINNAGLILNQLERSELGFQMTLTINHFGHFYLTYLLFDTIAKSPQARILNVSSMAHYSSPNNMLQDLELKSSSFSSISQYNKSKFLNVLFTVGLADRISKFQNIKTASLHPGIIDTGFGHDSWLINAFKCCCCCIIKSSQEGCRTSVHLTTCPFNILRNGQYYHSDTNHKQMDQRARNKQLVQKLWKISEKAYQIEFTI